jgi:hypothetical protein
MGNIPYSLNCVVVQPTTGLIAGAGCLLYPELRYACTGLSKSNAYGVLKFVNKLGKIVDISNANILM